MTDKTRNVIRRMLAEASIVQAFHQSGDDDRGGGYLANELRHHGIRVLPFRRMNFPNYSTVGHDDKENSVVFVVKRGNVESIPATEAENHADVWPDVHRYTRGRYDAKEKIMAVMPRAPVDRLDDVHGIEQAVEAFPDVRVLRAYGVREGGALASDAYLPPVVENIPKQGDRTYFESADDDEYEWEIDEDSIRRWVESLGGKIITVADTHFATPVFETDASVDRIMNGIPDFDGISGRMVRFVNPSEEFEAAVFLEDWLGECIPRGIRYGWPETDKWRDYGHPEIDAYCKRSMNKKRTKLQNALGPEWELIVDEPYIVNDDWEDTGAITRFGWVKTND